MGTRGVLGHIIRGKKKAAYNHSDSYPEGLGFELLKFIHSLSEQQITQMIQNLEKIKGVDESIDPDEETQARYVASGFADLAVSGHFAPDWVTLLYNVQGAKALPHNLDGSLAHLMDGTDFEWDTVFCEWAYFVDWETKSFTVQSQGNMWQTTFDKLTKEWLLE